MNGKGIYKLDGFSLMGMLANLINTTILLAVPLTVAKIAGNGSWMAPIIAGISAAYIIYIVYRLSLLYPGYTLFEYLPLITGKATGKIIGIAYILIILYIVVAAEREAILLFYGTGIITFTPEFIIAGMFIISTTYGVAKGIEVIGRTFNLFWMPLALVYLSLAVISMGLWNMNFFLPLSEIDVSAVMQSSLLPQSYLGELVFLALLIPYCRSSREAFIAGNLANLIVTFYLLITIVAAVAILGPEFAGLVLYTPFYLADFIKPIGVKVFLVAMWAVAVWCKVSLFQFFLTDGITKLTGLNEHKPIILPIAVLLFFLPMSLNKDAVDFFNSLGRTFPGIMIFFGYLIPTLLLIVAQIRTKGKSQPKPTA